MRRSTVAIVVVGLLAAAAAATSSLTGEEPGMTPLVEAKTPTQGDLATFSATRVFFGHQSVGSNVIAGVSDLFVEPGSPPLAVVETRDAIAADGGFLSHTHVGVNGDPLGKFDDFAAILGGSLGDEVDIAVLKLCYVDVTASTDVEQLFAAYANLMERLETEHPDVRFLYATAPLSTDRGWKQVVKAWIGRDDQMGPADNLARQRYNELVRQRYGDTGRLFDIAAVESTIADAPTSRQLDGATYYVLNQGFAADPGHLNPLGSRAAGAEFIRLVAAQKAR